MTPARRKHPLSAHQDPARTPAAGASRIIGIDPGTRIMGYGVIEALGPALACVAYGAISVPPALPLSERLLRLHAELLVVMERYLPQVAAVEEPFVAKNPRSALLVGQGLAIALLAAAQCGLAVSRYPPAKIKSAVAGHGQGSKARVQQLVRLRLGLAAVPEPVDAADALAVAICHLQEQRLHQAVARAQAALGAGSGTPLRQLSRT